MKKFIRKNICHEDYEIVSIRLNYFILKVQTECTCFKQSYITSLINLDKEDKSYKICSILRAFSYYLHIQDYLEKDKYEEI